MKVEKELRKLTQRIGSDELLDEILEAYKEEMKADSYDVEQEYQENKKALEPVLDAAQKEELAKMEQLFTENLKYSIGFGFKRGLYAGFEQVFAGESTPEPFDSLAHEELMMIPGMEKHTEYYERRTAVNELAEKLSRGVEPQYREPVTAVFSTYEEKGLGVLRYAFYIGYCYALAAVEEVAPDQVKAIAGKISETEQEVSLSLRGQE